MTKIIALDAGHANTTAGKRTLNGAKGVIHEWTLNDKVRDYVVEYLKDYDCKFIFTDNNEGNVDEGLTARRTTYVNAKADVFVSIHHNAYTGKWNNATGVEVFTDRKPTAEDNRLAQAIYKNLPSYIGLRGRGIKKENWTVIFQDRIPAVLCEGGFMDSTIDYPVITSEAGQKGYARAIAEGLIEFLDLKKKTAVEDYSGYVKVIFDGLAIHDKPSWDNSTVCGTVKKNEIFTIKGRIKVDGVYMYLLKSGKYITSATKYVEYLKTLNAPKVVAVGAKVKVANDAVIGGLASNRGKKASNAIAGKTHVVSKIQTNKGVKEALLKGVNTWIAVKYLTAI